MIKTRNVLVVTASLALLAAGPASGQDRWGNGKMDTGGGSGSATKGGDSSYSSSTDASAAGHETPGEASRSSDEAAERGAGSGSGLGDVEASPREFSGTTQLPPVHEYHRALP